MKKILLLAAFAVAGLSASAQTSVPQKNVPQIVQNVLTKQYSEKALKKTVWFKIENDYEGNYDGSNGVYRLRINDDATLIWEMKYIEYTQLPKEVYEHFKKKYDSQNRYESAWEVKQSTDGQTMYFIVGVNGHTPYYFKYDDQNQMVEKVACGIDFKFNKYKKKPKPVVEDEPDQPADSLQLQAPDASAVSDTLQVINYQPLEESNPEGAVQDN